MGLEEIGGLVAEELHAVAALKERDPLGGEAFQFDRSDFGAVLLLLRALLRVLIRVEFARDAITGAVEQIHRRPQEIVEVGFETGFTKASDEGVEDVGERASHACLLGQGTRVALVLMRAAAVELQFVEEMAGRGNGVTGLEFGLPIERHGSSACCGRANRGLCGDPFAAGRLGPHRAAQRSGRSGAKDGGRQAVLSRDAKPACFRATHFSLAWRGRQRKTVG